MSSTARVLTGLLSGAALGIVLTGFQPSLARDVASVTQPVGDLWLHALQVTVVPLVVALVVLGVASTSDVAASGRTARRAILVFLVLLCAGAAFAAVFAPFQLSLLPRDPELIESLRATIGAPAAPDVAAAGFAERFATIIPSNVIAAAAQSAMLPLVVCALLFGFALTRIEARRRTQAVDLFQTLSEAMIIIVRWVLWVGPLGVFALAFSMCVKAGVSVLSALGWYILAMCTLYLAVTLGLYFVAVFAGGQRLRQFAAGILPAQVIAASTQSSLATLPAMVESAQNRLGCSPAVTALVLPMAVSLFRMTSPVQYIGVSCYIAWIYGVDLSASQLAVGAALAVVISLGSVGLPGQVSLMAMNMPVVQAMGLPVAPLGLMLAVETIPDAFATLGNVTGDLSATTVVARKHEPRVMSDTNAIDAVIIGAGIAGTSVAYFMSGHAKVLVLERESHPGLHSTGRSAALFSECYGTAQVRALTRASRSFLERPPRGFVEHALLSPRGTLVIGSYDQAAQVDSSYQAMRDFTSLQLLDERQMQSMVPVLEPQFARIGFFEPGAADIDVNSLHQGFIRGLKQRGSRLECDVQIHSIERIGEEWLLEVAMRGAQPHTLRAPLLIDAAGAWADEVAALAGVAPLGIEPRRRSAFLFQPPDGVATAHWPFVTSVAEEFYFKPDAGLLLGSPANADPVVPHDVQPEELDIALAIDRIERATTLRIQRPMRPWAGLRTFVADGGLVGGFDPVARGFFWIAALGGYGIQTCTAMGEACAHLALGRSLPTHLTDAGLTAAMLGVERLRSSA